MKKQLPRQFDLLSGQKGIQFIQSLSTPQTLYQREVLSPEKNFQQSFYTDIKI